MIEFVPLASSSAGCAYLVKAEGHSPLLLDAGIPFEKLQKMLWNEDVSLSDLAGCLISHGHGDHAKAVPKLMASGVDCYASQEAWGSIIATNNRGPFFARKYMGVGGHRQYVLVHGRSEYMPSFEAQPDDPTRWRVTPFAAVHDSAGTMGFLIDALDRGNLLYLTDSAYSPYRFENLTHICVEANYSEDILKENAMAGAVAVDVAKRTLQTHASIERVIDMLKANDLSKCQEIWLLHLSAANSDAEDFKARVQKACGVPTYVAKR